MCAFVIYIGAIMSNSLILSRFNNGPEGSFGNLIFPSSESFFTCEPPWLNNKPYDSCIPQGVYYLEKRHSPIVKRTSGGRYSEGWEVLDVTGRSYIMIHPGNWPMDTDGCILPGMRYGISKDRRGQWSNSVLDSIKAFVQVMELLEEYNSWSLDIRYDNPSFI
jgi:hypothetical protein